MERFCLKQGQDLKPLAALPSQSTFKDPTPPLHPPTPPYTPPPYSPLLTHPAAHWLDLVQGVMSYLFVFCFSSF